MKKELLFAILLSVSLAAAEEVSLAIQTDQSCLPYPSSFEATIVNYQAKEDTIGISAVGGNAHWASFSERTIRLGAQQSGNMIVSVLPPPDTPNGFYYFDLYSYSVSDPQVRAFGRICLAVIEGYNAGVAGVQVPEEINPGEPLAVLVTVQNLGTRAIEGAALRVVTGFGEGTVTVSLAEGEVKRLTVKIPTASQAPAGPYDVVTSLDFRGRRLHTSRETFSIREVAEFVKTERRQWSPIIDFRAVDIRNTGNVRIDRDIQVTVGFPWNYLVSAKGAAVSAAKGATTYVWRVTLSPGQQTSVFYNVNYWPILLASMAAFFAVTRFYLGARNINIAKRAFNHGKEFKVALHIRNNAGKPLRNVVVRDVVPSILKVSGFYVNPPDVRSRAEGVELEWKFQEMLPGEERILSYGIKPLLGTPDYFMLPGAKARGEGDGRMFLHSTDYTKLGTVPVDQVRLVVRER